MPTNTGTTFSPGLLPTYSGSTITLDLFLKQPAKVAQAVSFNLDNYFIADKIFNPNGTPAESGAVQFNQWTALPTTFFPSPGRDVQSIAPGAEFPLLDMQEEIPMVAQVAKYGGAMQFTYEDIRRNTLDKLSLSLIRMRNAVTRKVDALAVSTLKAAPIRTMAVATAWSALTSTNWANLHQDVQTAIATVEDPDLGYKIDSVICTRSTALRIMTNGDVKSMMLANNTNPVLNPLASKELGRLYDLDWYITNRVTNDEIIFFQSHVVGSISNEPPGAGEKGVQTPGGTMTNVVIDELRQRKVVQAWRACVPYVTDPKAAIRVTNINAGTP